MFKKITSNRDPKDTVFSELKNEFRPYLDSAGNHLKGLAKRYPTFLFWMMVINITLSIVLVNTVFKRKTDNQQHPVKMVPAPVNDGIDQLLAASRKLKVTFGLKKQVDSLFHKKQLSREDSAVLLQDLDSLKYLQKNLNHNP